MTFDLSTSTDAEFTPMSTNDTVVPSKDFVPTAQRFVVPYMGNADPDARMAVLKALANDAGLRLPNTILPEGTALLPIGEENRRKLKVKLDALPELFPALDAYDARLRAEDPKDVKVRIQQVRMDPLTGKLVGPAGKPINYTADGFAQAAQFIKPLAIRNGFSENILALPNELRSQVFNHWASSSTRSEEAIVRVFQGGNGTILRAVTSTKHSLETGDDRAITKALRRIQPGAKVRITREPGGRLSEVEVIWPMLDRQLRVGDVAYGGIRITNSETKASAVRVEAFVLRVLCYNFTTAFSEDFEADELSLKHVGDLTAKLPALISKAAQRIEPLVLAFGDAFKDALPAAMPTRGEVLEKTRKMYGLPETTMALAAQMWDADGLKSAGDTRAGLVNALTRASQEQGISDAAQTERVAGRIILDGWAALA